MLPEKSLLIAVDFDGTIVENKYPNIGKPLLFAFETLIRLQQEGHRLILWTYRCGPALEEAINFCTKNGVEFYSINKSFPEEETTVSESPKINADIFIDDRNIGGFIGWGEVYQLLSKKSQKREQPLRKHKKRRFPFLKKK